jgi:biotin carboxyl carrier protein
MPGRVIDINVALGQEVQPGDILISLEAMKMENALKSEGVGIVKAICIDKGAVVDKGAVLIEFE